jgi:4'-phosphopantetheinyl transferase
MKPVTRSWQRPRPPCDRISAFKEHPEGRIALWHGSLQHSRWSSLLEALSDEERRRAETLVFERDARRFVVSHFVLRVLLGRLTATPASRVKLRGERGAKPVLETVTGRPIHFSLSRAGERVLIGVAPRPLGVDLEWLGRTLDIEGLADQALSRRELDAFRGLDPGSRREAFLRCWTQKEAYLKAIGEGLRLPPNRIEVSVVPAAPPGVISIQGDRAVAAQWFVAIVAPEADYLGAVAAPGRAWQLEMTRFDTSSLPIGR